MARWLVGAILLLLVALLLDFGLLAYAMYALLGVLVLSRWLADSWSANLSATRETNRDRVEIGDQVAVVVTLENKGWLPIPWLLLEDLLPRQALLHNPPNLQVLGRRLQLVSFRSRMRKTILYQLQCNRRGYYQLGPLVAETGDVFGLYRRYRILSEPGFLLAYPKVIGLAGFDIASRRPIGEVRLSHRLYEDPTRMAGVRSYQAGDPLNRIHWGATAATGQLHSNNGQTTATADDQCRLRGDRRQSGTDHGVGGQLGVLSDRSPLHRTASSAAQLCVRVVRLCHGADRSHLD